MATSALTYGPMLPDDSGGIGDAPASDLVFGNVNQLAIGSLYDPTSGFDPNQSPVDPTNTGDTGGVQNVSTPAFPSKNNPETAAPSSFGAAIGSAINAAFAGWQLSSQPKGTTRTITTQVGQTRVVSGQTGLASIFGTTASSSSNTLLILGVLLLVGLYLYKR